MFRKKRSENKDSSGVLKKKAMVCSTEAAAISIGIHVLLILFAGSIVAIRYVQKRDAAFAGENVSRPKLERRQLQMPVKVQNLQKKSSRPKVTTRMASVSQASFSLPDMMGMGDLGAGGFDRGSTDRSLSNMGSAGNLGFGVSGVNFFGAKSKGEKMVFILDASKLMVEDRKGGFFTYKFAKDRLMHMIDGMSSATLFNVMAYVNNQLVMFSPKLVPATPDNREAVKKWIAPLNSSPAVVAKLDQLPGQYRPPYKYEASPLDHPYPFVQAIQAAMEQKPDNIFLLCSGYGIPRPSEPTIMKKNDIDSKEEWLERKGWDAERIQNHVRERREQIARAKQTLAKENEARKAAGQPPKFVQDWWYYIRHELKWPISPEMPHLYSLVPHGMVPPEWFIEHLEVVYEFNYVPQKLPKPAVHIVKLIASDGTPYELPGGDGSAFRLISLKQVPRAFKGRFELLRGAESMEDILKNNNLADD